MSQVEKVWHSVDW